MSWLPLDRWTFSWPEEVVSVVADDRPLRTEHLAYVVPDAVFKQPVCLPFPMFFKKTVRIDEFCRFALRPC